jgi:pyruvate dehydrogenase E2 component (dihydrolipoamide acetyltransferase)
MATEFLMPKLGLTMEEGTILEWLVADGDEVKAGSAVLRIETDKTETDVEAAESGRLHRLGNEGDTYSCGERIGWFLADGEEAPASPASSVAASTGQASAQASVQTSVQTLVAAAAPATQSSSVAATLADGRVIASPIAKRLAKERNIDLRTIRGTGPGGRIVSEDLDGIIATPAPSTPQSEPLPAPTLSISVLSVPATSAARQLADLLGVNLGAIPVDPLDGRVTKEAVALHVRALLADAAALPQSSPQSSQTSQTSPVVEAPKLLAATQQPTSTVRMSGMRGTIAKRMHESLTQMAQLTLQMDANLDAVVADRDRRKTDGAPPSYTDYVIAAAARALMLHPIANSQITDDGVALLPVVHVGMAVALDNGLIVPVIKNTATLDLASLSSESTRLADAARAGALGLPDLEGGTFSVSTLGMFGVDGFTPVINPPNTAILGVGRLHEDLVLDANGQVAPTKRLTLSLTWDHRAFDGAPAAAFCKSIADLLGDPSALDNTGPNA